MRGNARSQAYDQRLPYFFGSKRCMHASFGSLLALVVISWRFSPAEGQPLQSFADVVAAGSKLQAGSNPRVVAHDVVLRLGSGTFDVSESATFDFSGYKNGATFSIIGQGLETTILDCGHGDVGPALKIIGATAVDISGLTVRNCRTVNDGGAIKIDTRGGVNITDCAFTGCSANAMDIWGGGVYITSPTTLEQDIVIDRCTFADNSAMNGGGLTIDGVTTSGQVTIKDCAFTNNTGGGAFMQNLNAFRLDVTNTTFFSNKARYGGGLELHEVTVSDTLAINACVFNKNSASSNGGGLLFSVVTARGNVTVQDCSFVDNTADNWGGGTHAYQLAADHMSFGGTTFFTNSAETGGGLSISGGDEAICGPLEINNCTFIGNSASSDGGAAYVTSCNTSDLAVKVTTFSGNQAQYGGGMYLDNITTTGAAAFTGCTFNKNSANGNGGGLLFNIVTTHGNTTVQDCSFVDNSATGVGGGAHAYQLSALQLSFSATTFYTNSAETGSGLTIAGGDEGVCGPLEINNCTFNSNTANSSGGAAYVESCSTAYMAFKATAFIDNQAQYGGGLVLSSVTISGILAFDGCTFSENTASKNGGGLLYNIGTVTGSVTVHNSTFNNNTAKYNGAGAYVYQLASSQLTVGQSHFIGNDAEFGGGLAFYDCTSTGNMTVNNCTFNANTADYGGGTYMQNLRASHLGVTTTTFSGNMGQRGGGLHISDSNVTKVSISDCQYQANEDGENGAHLYIDGLQPLNDTLDEPLLVIITDSDFSDCISSSGGAVFIEDIQGDVTVRGSTFVNNNAWAALKVDSGALSVRIDSCRFDHNSVFRSAYIEAVTQVYIHNSTWYNNWGVGLYLSQTDAVVVRCQFQLQDNDFDDSDGHGGAVITSYGQMEFHSCNFDNNKARVGGAIYAADGTRLMIDPCYHHQSGGFRIGMFGKFSQQWPTEADSFVADSANWASTSFVGNNAYSGGAIAVIGSNVKISNPAPDMMKQCTYASKVAFINNTAYTGGAITLMPGASDELTSLSYMFLSGNKALKLAANETDKKSIADQYGLGAGNGGAIACVFTENSKQFISNSTFVGNTAYGYGGALYVGSDPESCSDVDNCFTLRLQGSYIVTDGDSDDRSSNGDVVRMSGNVAYKGAGGAIYYEGQGSVNISCNLGCNSTCNSTIFSATPCTFWEGNSAVVGNTTATTPMRAQMVFSSQGVYNPAPGVISNYTSGSDMTVNITLYDYYNNPLSFNVLQANPRLTNIVTFTADNADKSASGQLQTQVGGVQSTNAFTGLRLRRQSGPQNLTLLGVVTALRRQLPNVTVSVDVRKCMIGEVSREEGTICDRCDAGQYNTDPNNRTADCQMCPDNAQCNGGKQEISGIIVPADEFWNSNPFSEQILQCFNPDACRRLGRQDDLIQYQYNLRTATNVTPFNWTQFYDVMCAEGYTGNFCAECAPGYGWTGPARCSQCYDLNTLYYSLLTLAALIPFFLAGQGAISTARELLAHRPMVKKVPAPLTMTPEEEAAMGQEEPSQMDLKYPTISPFAHAGADMNQQHSGNISGYQSRPVLMRSTAMKTNQVHTKFDFDSVVPMIKVTMSYLQVLSLMMYINIPRMPGIFGQLVAVSNTVSQVPGSAISLECSLPYDLENKAEVSVIIRAAVPAGAMLAMIVFVLTMPKLWRLLRAGWKRMTTWFSGHRLPEADDARIDPLPAGYKTVIVIIAGIFAFYEMYVSLFLSVLSCASGDGDSDNVLAVQTGLLNGLWWRLDFGQLCYEGAHATLAYALGIPGIIAFGLLIPVWTFWYLLRNSHRLGVPEFEAMWGFLYSEYRPEMCAWEVAIMIRKVAASAVAMLVGSSPDKTGTQILISEAIIATALVAHLVCQPYEERHVSRLETLSLATILATLYICMYTVIPDTPESANSALPWVVVAINFVTVAVLIWSIFSVFVHTMASQLELHETVHTDPPPDEEAGDDGACHISRSVQVPLTGKARVRTIQKHLQPTFGKLSVPASYIVSGMVSATELQQSTSRELSKTVSELGAGARKVLGWEEAHEAKAMMSTTSGGPASSRSISNPYISRNSRVGSAALSQDAGNEARSITIPYTSRIARVTSTRLSQGSGHETRGSRTGSQNLESMGSQIRPRD